AEFVTQAVGAFLETLHSPGAIDPAHGVIQVERLCPSPLDHLSPLACLRVDNHMALVIGRERENVIGSASRHGPVGMYMVRLSEEGDLGSVPHGAGVGPDTGRILSISPLPAPADVNGEEVAIPCDVFSAAYLGGKVYMLREKALHIYSMDTSLWETLTPEDGEEWPLFAADCMEAVSETEIFILRCPNSDDFTENYSDSDSDKSDDYMGPEHGAVYGDEDYTTCMVPWLFNTETRSWKQCAPTPPVYAVEDPAVSVSAVDR
ncbi:hypothetical protein KIPB_011581, partial [Kipferlia bialata]